MLARERLSTATSRRTLNLVTDDYPDTRDFAVIDTNPADVAAIVATSNADFAGRPITPPDGADLVWSPTKAEASILSVINGATHTLAVEDEEIRHCRPGSRRAPRRGRDHHHDRRPPVAPGEDPKAPAGYIVL